MRAKYLSANFGVYNLLNTSILSRNFSASATFKTGRFDPRLKGDTTLSPTEKAFVGIFRLKNEQDTLKEHKNKIDIYFQAIFSGETGANISTEHLTTMNLFHTKYPSFFVDEDNDNDNSTDTPAMKKMDKLQKLNKHFDSEIAAREASFLRDSKKHSY